MGSPVEKLQKCVWAGRIGGIDGFMKQGSQADKISELMEKLSDKELIEFAQWSSLELKKGRVEKVSQQVFAAENLSRQWLGV